MNNRKNIGARKCGSYKITEYQLNIKMKFNAYCKVYKVS